MLCIHLHQALMIAAFWKADKKDKVLLLIKFSRFL